MSTKKTLAALVLSTSLVLGSSVAAIATESTEVTAPVSAPVATSKPTNPAREAYRAAMAEFKTAMTQFKADRISFQTAMQAHRTAMTAYNTASHPINDAFNASVDSAPATLQPPLEAATTNEQKTAAYNAMKAAVSAAISTREAAITALGPVPVKPAKPTKPERPAKPVKPTPAPTATPN